MASQAGRALQPAASSLKENAVDQAAHTHSTSGRSPMVFGSREEAERTFCLLSASTNADPPSPFKAHHRRKHPENKWHPHQWPSVCDPGTSSSNSTAWEFRMQIPRLCPHPLNTDVETWRRAPAIWAATSPVGNSAARLSLRHTGPGYSSQLC